jgi:hypothetical protein
MPTAVPLLVRLVVVAHKRLVGPQGSRSSEYMIRRYTSRRQRFESLGLMSDAVYTTVRWETDIVRLTRFVTRWCGRWHVIDRRSARYGKQHPPAATATQSPKPSQSPRIPE